MKDGFLSLSAGVLLTGGLLEFSVLFREVWWQERGLWDQTRLCHSLAVSLQAGYTAL